MGQVKEQKTMPHKHASSQSVENIWPLNCNKTKSLKSREKGELKSIDDKSWLMTKVDWWLKSTDD